MEDLTLIIPAKNESESLPSVLEEIKDYSCKKIVILESIDSKLNALDTDLRFPNP